MSTPTVQARARALLAAWRAELHRSYVVHGVPGVVYADADVARDIAELDEVIAALSQGAAAAERPAEARAPISDDMVDTFLSAVRPEPFQTNPEQMEARKATRALLESAVACASQRDSLTEAARKALQVLLIAEADDSEGFYFFGEDGWKKLVEAVASLRAALPKD